MTATAAATAATISPAIATARRPRSARRHLSMLLAAIALATAALGANDPSAASAYSPSARSYGFTCSSNGWVKNWFPSIATTSATPQNVYFRSDLYRWNGSQWTFYASKGWYGGASNQYGRLALGTFFGVPYYFVLGSGVVFDGAVFNNLPRGYYRTAEYYSASGSTWSRWSFVNGSSAAWCAI